MRWGLSILGVAGLALAGFCSDQPSNLPVLPCAQALSQAPGCNPSRKDLKLAKKAFDQGLKLQSAKRTDEALEQFEMAARLAKAATFALAMAKDAVNRGLEVPLDKGLEIEARNFAKASLSEDAVIGIMSFLSKQEPQFRGK